MVHGERIVIEPIETITEGIGTDVIAIPARRGFRTGGGGIRIEPIEEITKGLEEVKVIPVGVEPKPPTALERIQGEIIQPTRDGRIVPPLERRFPVPRVGITGRIVAEPNIEAKFRTAEGRIVFGRIEERVAVPRGATAIEGANVQVEAIREVTPFVLPEEEKITRKEAERAFKAAIPIFFKPKERLPIEPILEPILFPITEPSPTIARRIVERLTKTEERLRKEAIKKYNPKNIINKKTLNHMLSSIIKEN